jgi:hypothetical protein
MHRRCFFSSIKDSQQECPAQNLTQAAVAGWQYRMFQPQNRLGLAALMSITASIIQDSRGVCKQF